MSSKSSSSNDDEIDEYMLELLQEAAKYDMKKKAENKTKNNELSRQPSQNDDTELFGAIFGYDENSNPPHSDAIAEIVLNKTADESNKSHEYNDSIRTRKAVKEARKIRRSMKGGKRSNKRKSRRKTIYRKKKTCRKMRKNKLRKRRKNKYTKKSNK